MSASHILDLKDDCLRYLLDYLSTEDQICYAQACQRFRDVFIDWAGRHYRHFTIDEKNSRQELIRFCICREAVEELTIDLDHFDSSRALRNYGCVAPLNCFSILSLALTGMTNLRKLIVKQLKFMLLFAQPFEKTLAAVKDLKQLKVLELHAIDDFTFDNLGQLKHLEELHLIVKTLSGPALTNCCKSNPNLRHLHLGFSSVQRILSDIAPHCANLETLQFGMIGEAPAYKAIAKLPKLRQLIYYGIRSTNSFLPLLTGLAARPQLQRLDIDGGSLSTEETRQLVRLSGLQQLKCFCSTAECVEMLAQLTQLQALSIWMSSRVDISAAMLRVIGECKQLQQLRIASGNLNSDFINDVSEILCANKTGPDKRSLKLEVPVLKYVTPKLQLIEGNQALSCSEFELASWKNSN
ncbi:uncharacterized protein LOC6583020 [Drosophila mojavensis]|uniref:Uncharacterized protein, isoform A n=1 Tax=Drosophila mojavensis TaxID=7230 RepID=B4L0S5_DROMO|nr:uncharacterized protein LOC6583020 [Drosophila mojavensis]EDW19175.2 uncharacterized protein Dmoj_GI13640, isoform A [Drosophila mojavensis]